MTYPGGKAGSGAAHRIINLMPPHSVYIEPFGGSAAVAKLKREAALNVICDLDPTALAMARDTGAARQVQRGRPKSAVSTMKSCICMNGESAGDIGGSGDVVSRWIWIVGDGLEFLEHHQFSGDELVYCDPPYVRSTRRSTKDLYNFEWDDHHHSRLLAWAAASKARVILSGYASRLYDSALGGWECESFQVSTRRGPATETLWWNFPRPTILHDDRYLGDGFRERERIRRRQSRWIARLQRMEPTERHAIIGAVRSLID